MARHHGNNYEHRVHVPVLQYLLLWLPELVAAVLTLALIAATIIQLKKFDGVDINDVDPPAGLTPNDLIAIFETLSRACVTTICGSTITQESWLWFSRSARKLGDLERSDTASRGPVGGAVLLFLSPHRYEVPAFALRVTHSVHEKICSYQRSPRWLASLTSLMIILCLEFGPFTQ